MYETLDLISQHIAYDCNLNTLEVKAEGSKVGSHWAGNTVWMVECLLNKKPCVEYLPPHKPDMVAHACNYSIWEMEAGQSEIQGHSWLHGKFKANLGYLRPCLKQNKTIRLI